MTPTPQEAWQYGAVIIVIAVVGAFLAFFKKAGESAIRAFEAIAKRIEEHESRDEERHSEILESLARSRRVTRRRKSDR